MCFEMSSCLSFNWVHASLFSRTKSSPGFPETKPEGGSDHVLTESLCNTKMCSRVFMHSSFIHIQAIIMKFHAVILLCSLFGFTQQSPQDDCACALTSKEKAFPLESLNSVNEKASKCTNTVTQQKAFELESMLLGLEHRLPQLLEDVSVLEKEDDGGLYGVVSLQVIQNELKEIKERVDKLNTTTQGHQHLYTDSAKQAVNLRVELQELELYDTFQVEKKQQENQRLKRALHECKAKHEVNTPPTQPPHDTCPHGKFVNITGPEVFSQGEFAGSYKYGGWGRDPKPEAGEERWYWRVMMTSSNRYANYVRYYSSLSTLVVGVGMPVNFQINPSNPTTNTVQGPNVVLYGKALYYNCYNKDDVCRFNLTSKTVSTLQLPKGTRYNSKGNYCHLEECYPYTDMDLATDESGVWVIYSTVQHYGNLVLSKLEEGDPPTLGQTWHTSVFKQAVTNTFMACGTLYATRYIDKSMEEIFYSLDTVTGVEKFNVGIFINKMSPNINFLNYSPIDQMLYVYSDANMVSYKVLFE
ncbi:olfactomedin-4-like isoform X2 [Entelurus aequoreus]|uniref:olfactomedin-4-like isoform X2 n=1 Tax=Entelurus aequoreus TaxID=161455 RepID=UPI002B1D9EA0|nr:olfactomedin-4-like isoform X2 [Entelurus aequoreus]